jgi:hypothetical protein
MHYSVSRPPHERHGIPAQRVPLAEVSRRLGHADQNITLAIYSHAVPADSRAAAKIWDDALGDVIEVGRKAGAVRTVAQG